jgi:hypothetical protein
VWGAVLLLWLAIVALVLRSEVHVGVAAAGWLAALGLLTGWTLLSRIWSDAPAQTLLEARRDLVYVGAAAAVLAACGRLGARTLAGALLAALELVVAVAIVRYLTVSPSHRIVGNQGALLSWPAGYANAIAALAAIAVPLALAFAAHARSLAGRVAAGAGIPPLVVALVLSQSRGGSIAAIVAALVLLWLDPRRRAVGWTAARVAGPVAVVAGACVWSRLTDVALTTDEVRRGRIVVAAVLVVTATAAAIATSARRPAPRGRIPSRRATVSVVAAAAVLAAVVAALPQLHRTAALRQLIGTQRTAYWTTAWTEIRAHPARGGGAGTFGLAWLQHGRPAQIGGALDDHNVYLETLAELGPPGLLLLLAALAAPLATLPRAIAASRVGAAAAAGYAAFAADAFVEWDWELPAVTTAGLLLGGTLLVLATERASTPPLGSRTRTAAIAVAILLALLALLGLRSHALPAATAAAAAVASGTL